MTGGDSYLPWLLSVHEDSHGNADLSAHFLRRCVLLLGEHGTAGFITTNSIAQGDTRASGLAYLLRRGVTIYGATTRLPWVGGPNVAVSVIHLAKGRLRTTALPARLDGATVESINSQLHAGAERPDPKPLRENAGCAFIGPNVLGTGFMLSQEERLALVQRNAKNAALICSYVGGRELNASPTQKGECYVINFGDRALEAAEAWPELLAIVRERVKPDRDKNNRDNYRLNWWKFAEGRPGLLAAIAPLRRCLALARITKHLCISFQPTDRILNEMTCVFPLDSVSAFTVLQSRIHEVWARCLSSTLEDRAATARLLYSASDCFSTFPFPSPDPRTVLPPLEDIGQRLHDFRAKYMVDENVGLTVTYNRLKDPACDDARILELRRLHEEMDRKVLQAYAEDDPQGRWLELGVPPFCQMGDEDKKKLEKFEHEVIDRLFVLNAKRAEEEKVKALGANGGKKKATPKKGRGKKAEGQMVMGDPEGTEGG